MLAFHQIDVTEIKRFLFFPPCLELGKTFPAPLMFYRSLLSKTEREGNGAYFFLPGLLRKDSGCGCASGDKGYNTGAGQLPRWYSGTLIQAPFFLAPDTATPSHWHGPICGIKSHLIAFGESQHSL